MSMVTARPWLLSTAMVRSTKGATTLYADADSDEVGGLKQTIETCCDDTNPDACPGAGGRIAAAITAPRAS